MNRGALERLSEESVRTALLCYLNLNYTLQQNISLLGEQLENMKLKYPNADDVIKELKKKLDLCNINNILRRPRGIKRYIANLTKRWKHGSDLKESIMTEQDNSIGNSIISSEIKSKHEMITALIDAYVLIARLYEEEGKIKYELNKYSEIIELGTDLKRCQDTTQTLGSASRIVTPRKKGIGKYIDKFKNAVYAKLDSETLKKAKQDFRETITADEKATRKAARERAFGENAASNSGTPIWDRVKRFRKPPTDDQKLRAKYRQVRKTKGNRNWESVKSTPIKNPK
uniref:Uncharacterized protein n=1 Tax=viral metagenome TaxID=1070528 RepID=A0A6C0CKB6_9ZZZZ